MNRRSLSLCAAALLLLGTGAWFLFFKSSAMEEGRTSAKAGGRGTSRDTVESGRKGGSAQDPAASGRSRRTASTWPDLVAKYGESRTNLCHQVVGTAATLLEGMANLREGEGGSGTSSSVTSLASTLDLSADQKTALRQLLDERADLHREELKTLAADLRKDPGLMMELLLAGDARARDRISAEQYDSTARPAAAALEHSTGIPLASWGPRNELKSLMADPAFNTSLKELLDPSQAATWQQQLEKSSAVTVAGIPPEWLRPMELEKMGRELDGVVEWLGTANEKAKAKITGP